MIPLMFDLADNYEECERYIKVSDKMPRYLFLRWMPQMIARLSISEDTHVQRCVSSVIDKLIERYPQAVYCPLRVASDDSKSAQIARQFSIVKQKCLSLDALVTSMHDLHHPNLRLLDDIKKMMVMASARASVADLDAVYQSISSSILSSSNEIYRKYVDDQNIKKQFNDFLGAKLTVPHGKDMNDDYTRNDLIKKLDHLKKMIEKTGLVNDNSTCMLCLTSTCSH